MKIAKNVDIFVLFAYDVSNRTPHTSPRPACDVSQGGAFLFLGVYRYEAIKRMVIFW